MDELPSASIRPSRRAQRRRPRHRFVLPRKRREAKRPSPPSSCRLSIPGRRKMHFCTLSRSPSLMGNISSIARRFGPAFVNSRRRRRVISCSNGKPYFLRGVGYDSIEPVTGFPVPEKKSMPNACGAEAVRIQFRPLPGPLSVKEFFEAADEEGFLVQTKANGSWAVGLPCRLPPAIAHAASPQDDPRVPPSSIMVCLQLS